MIDILLATYNGEKYLAEQLNSLFSQSYHDFRILVRDDGSTDKTLAILETFSKQHPNKIFLLESKEHLGPKGSFSALMKASTSPYIMFCDQDDLWKKDKIALSLQRIQEMEHVSLPHTPILVHSDLVVINDKGRPIHYSFWKYANLSAKKFTTINRLLTQNVVTGCSVIMNRALCEAAYPIPECAYMHDWWVALVASLFGKIGVIKKPTIFYRQHTENMIGAKKFGSFRHVFERLGNINHDDEVKLQQAEYLLSHFEGALNDTHKQIIEDYTRLKTLSWIDSRFVIMKQGFFKCGFRRNVFCLLMKRQP